MGLDTTGSCVAFCKPYKLITYILDKCLHVDDNYMSQVTFIIQIFPSPSTILIMSLYRDGQQCS